MTTEIVKWQFRDRRDSDDRWSEWMDCPTSFRMKYQNDPEYQFRPLYASTLLPVLEAGFVRTLEGLIKAGRAAKPRHEGGYGADMVYLSPSTYAVLEALVGQ